MEFLELAKSRYSVRSFKDEPIKMEEIEKILEAGGVAPTACNNQPIKILAIQSEEGLRKFRMCTECHFNAPLAFVVCYDKNQYWKRSYDGKDSGDVDASIVATHMMLEAYDLGIGSTWVMYFIPEAIKTEFELPENLEPVCVLPMGYPKEGNMPSKLHSQKKSIEEIAEFK